MFNEITKHITSKSISLSLFLGFTISVASCGGESENTRNARVLFEQAQALDQQSRPEEAILLLDSLQKTYPSEIEWQREAMKLRPTLIISASEKQIEAINDSIAFLEDQYNTLMNSMKKIADARLVEPYWVDKATYTSDFLNNTGIQARVDEIGQFYFLSSVNPGGLKHTGFTLKNDNGSVAVGPVPYDGEMNYRINNSEVVTYSPKDCEQAGILISQNPDSPTTLTFTGARNKSVKLSSKQVKAIANCYNFSQSIIRARQLSFERERLNRQKEIATRQAETINARLSEE